MSSKELEKLFDNDWARPTLSEEILNADGSRNWEANILMDNIKRLEKENKALKEQNNNLRAELHRFYCLEPGKIIPENEVITFMGKSPEYWLNLQREYNQTLKSFVTFQETLLERVGSMNRKLNEVLDVKY
jgi:hypothetical protein